MESYMIVNKWIHVVVIGGHFIAFPSTTPRQKRRTRWMDRVDIVPGGDSDSLPRRVFLIELFAILLYPNSHLLTVTVFSKFYVTICKWTTTDHPEWVAGLICERRSDRDKFFHPALLSTTQFSVRWSAPSFSNYSADNRGGWVPSQPGTGTERVADEEEEQHQLYNTINNILIEPNINIIMFRANVLLML